MLKQIKKLFRGLLSAISNEAGSIYRTNLLVSDLKGQYIKGCDSVVNLNNQRVEIQAQRKISLKELDNVETELRQVTKNLKAINLEDPSGISTFNVLKSKYDSLTNRKTNLEAAVAQYDSVLENLNKLIARTKAECEKLKDKYTEAEFNVQQYKSMKRINEVIATTTDSLAETNIDVEQVNNDLQLEIAKFSVRAESNDKDNGGEVAYVDDPEAMKAFINSL